MYLWEKLANVPNQQTDCHTYIVVQQLVKLERKINICWKKNIVKCNEINMEKGKDSYRKSGKRPKNDIFLTLSFSTAK